MDKSTDQLEPGNGKLSAVDEDGKSIHPEHHNRSLAYKIFKTIAMVLVWVAIGLWSEVNGPSLQELMFRTNSNYEIISQAVSMRGAGSLAGGILGGPIVDRFKHRSELIIAISLVGCAILTIIIPYSPYVWVIYAACIIEGIFEAFVNIAGQYLIMQTWQEKSNGPLHLLHLGYGAGGAIVPQILKPFLLAKLPESLIKLNPRCRSSSGNSTTNATASLLNGTRAGSNFSLASNFTDNSTTTAAPIIASDTLQYGFMIAAGMIVVIALIVFGDAFVNRRRGREGNDKEKVNEKQTIRQIFDLNTCSPGSPYFAFNIYFYMFFWFYLCVAGERIFAKYVTSFARSEACWDKQGSADLGTAFFISFTVGRFAGFVLTNFVPMPIIIIAEGIGNLGASLVLYFFSTNNTVLWACICILGFFIGPCYPSGLAWANRYIQVTGVGLTVLSVGAGVSDISFLSTVGYFIETNSLAVVPAFAVGFGGGLLLLAVVMQATACPKGDRFKREAEREEDEQVDTKL